MTSSPPAEAWARDFAARAAAFWTRERTVALFGRKHLLLPPGDSGPLLRALGLVRRDASMSPDQVRKYMQISHMLALLEPLLADLSRARSPVRVLDLACGRSYLSLLIGHSLSRRLASPLELVGVDRNGALLARCRERARIAGLDGALRFACAPIAGLDVRALWAEAFGAARGPGEVHCVVALHACDSATDDALALGIALEASVIAVVPCCHAELARRWAAVDPIAAAEAFGPVRASPHLRREAAAVITDALRMLLLRGAGYTVTAMEFVPAEHTPKNTLLRAVRNGRPEPEALREYVGLRAATGGAGIPLEELLPAELRTRLAAAAR